MSSSVIVIGAGIAGLSAALALGTRGHDVLILERDAPPPADLTPDRAWDWKRPGAPQSRQPHFLMARLRNLLWRDYPDLMETLLTQGLWELSFPQIVHPAAAPRFRQQPGDSDLASLAARRPSLELLMRRYVEQKGLARILSNVKVDALLADGEGNDVRISGVTVDRDGVREVMMADIVIDASGRGSRFHQQLARLGIVVEEEQSQAGQVYYTRHYQLLPGQDFPAIEGLFAAEFADFTAGAVPADNGAFTVTITLWRDDPILFEAFKDKGFFDAVCARIPRVAAWTDPARATAVSDVIGFGNMDFLWRRVGAQGPVPLGLFFVGDLLIRSNPKFGRGCTWAAEGVHKLAEIIDAVDDPVERHRRYGAMMHDSFRRDWDEMLKLEGQSRDKFERMIGRRRQTVGSRLGQWLEGHVMNVATLADADVQRAILRGVHGETGFTAWTRDPLIWRKVLRAALPSARNRRFRDAAMVRPSREDMAHMAGQA